ncbi:hypothetical protein LL3_03728 [Bacillus amyloliquefaciens LL3]|nr:hypothetical protein LL3_03728 [Bacillus amyloliquefaciens LL3]
MQTAFFVKDKVIKSFIFPHILLSVLFQNNYRNDLHMTETDGSGVFTGNTQFICGKSICFCSVYRTFITLLK